jgi:hypothetical protein
LVLYEIKYKEVINIKRLLIIPLIFLLVGCGDTQNQINSTDSQIVQQEVRYYKHVPVKIVKYQQTSFFKGMFKIYIEYKSEEYGLTQSMTIGNNEPYANECYMGQYKAGDTIYAVMYTWKQGDTVTRRQLGNLDYNR